MTLESSVPVFRSSGMFRLGRAAAPTGAWRGVGVEPFPGRRAYFHIDGVGAPPDWGVSIVGSGAAVLGTRTVALPYPEGSDPCLRRYPGA